MLIDICYYLNYCYDTGDVKLQYLIFEEFGPLKGYKQNKRMWFINSLTITVFFHTVVSPGGAKQQVNNKRTGYPR